MGFFPPNLYSTANETNSFTLSFYHIKIIFYVLLSKQICLCLAYNFAAFSFQNVIYRKHYADFC